MKNLKPEIMEDLPSEFWAFNDCAYSSEMDDLIFSNLNEKLDLHLNDFAMDETELQDIHDFIFDERKEIVHDCMWSGTCSDKCHPANEQSPVIPKVTAIAPTPRPEPATPTIPTVNPGRSLLINSPRQTSFHQTLNSIILPTKTIKHDPYSPPRPDTPQSLDDEGPPQFKYNLDLANCYPNSQIVVKDEIVVKEEMLEDEDEEQEDEEEEGYSEDEEYTNVREARNARENTVATDHSYTLSKNSKQARVELPGVQTPSDSEEEEEIDVVSLVEMNVTMNNRSPASMQTNPSMLARRQLQRKVASNLVAHSIPPPPRKRPLERSASPTNRHRKRPKAPKQRAQQHHHHNGHHAQNSRNSPTKRRPYSPNSDSEAENIERRSLHNDMERQRRIGLKNLFDELKSVVPSISAKDRAPKVVVLREAASLCMRVQMEDQDMDHEMEQLKMKQARLRARLSQLRREAAMRRPKNA